MRTKSCKNGIYTSKSKATKLNGQKDDKVANRYGMFLNIGLIF